MSLRSEFIDSIRASKFFKYFTKAVRNTKNWSIRIVFQYKFTINCIFLPGGCSGALKHYRESQIDQAQMMISVVLVVLALISPQFYVEASFSHHHLSDFRC